MGRPRAAPIRRLLPLLLFMVTTPMSPNPALADSGLALKPPVAAREIHVRRLHGELFEDPYFWMRERADPRVRAHLEAENAFADAWMAPTAALRERLYQEMLGRLREDDESVPWRKGDWLYFARSVRGLQHKVWLRRPLAGGTEQVLLDLNEIGRSGSYIALDALEISDDGRRLAYSLDRTGFRSYELHVEELDGRRPLLAPVAGVTSVAWAADGETLIYAVEDPAKRPWQVKRQKLGEAAGTIVFEERDERFAVAVERSRSGEWLFLTSSSHTASEVRIIPARQADEAPRVVEPRRPEIEYRIEHVGDSFYVRSNDAGRNFGLYRAPVAAPARENWRLLRAQDPAVMLAKVDAFAGHLVLTERALGLPRFRILDLSAPLGDEGRVVEFPEPAYSAQGSVNEEFAATAFRFGYQSPVTPSSVYEAALTDGSTTLLKRDDVPTFDPTRYEVERLEVRAADGARVPVTLVHRRGLERDGANPALLRGYGSYGISYPLSFDSAAVSLLDRGFVVAVAHVRGGGELGQAWHDQGRMFSKMNSFADFIAVAEELVRAGWTSSDRLAIAGGSAGGLLTGAVTNFRPDLFAVVLSYVPFVDVLNTMADSSLPLTVGEFEEWGNPAIPEQYAVMRAYSPYENLAPRDYPAMLVRTSINDSQVMYWEPAKYVARLRALRTDDRPLLFKVNLDAGGHGGFAGRYDKLRDSAYDWAFLLTRLGIAE